jgi:small ligand-binding sensory domain FIST
VGVRIGSGLSVIADPRLAAIEAASSAREGLGRGHADLAIVFAAGVHLAEPELSLDGVREALEPDVLVGCGAGGVLAGSHEIESGTGIVVWAAALGDGEATPFHSTVEELDDGLAVSGLPALDGAAAVVLLPDPFSYPTEGVLDTLSEHATGVPVIGGVASARRRDGDPALFIDGDSLEGGGAVGVRLDGVEVLPCVSQGAAPFGPELTITAAEGHVIHELAGRPAIDKLRDVVEDLPAHIQAILANDLLVGIVVDGDKPDYLQGDFLVRGILGGDPEDGSLAVGTPVSTGQVLRLHARDAGSADRDLRESLGIQTEALGGGRPAGALMFACNGRGRALFGEADHDAGAVAEAFGHAPVAGFFAAGEIGPVGGATFLHGFTATLAVFPG